MAIAAQHLGLRQIKPPTCRRSDTGCLISANQKGPVMYQRILVPVDGSPTSARGLDEEVKWGHLVYSSNGPVLLIRAEAQRVLFGFWRGKLLQSVEPRLKASGKYEMATLELREGMTATAAIVRKLTKAAIALNKSLGDPRDAAKPKSAAKRPRAKRARA